MIKVIYFTFVNFISIEIFKEKKTILGFFFLPSKINVLGLTSAKRKSLLEKH